MPKNVQTFALTSHTSKVMLKILQARLQQYVKRNFLMFKLILETAEEQEIKLPTSAGSWKKQESFRKPSTSAVLTMPKPLTLWITTNCWKFFKRWKEYTELYKKDLHDPDNHDGVITHLEPDILECEVKWALESITMNKASGGDGIPTSYWKS